MIQQSFIQKYGNPVTDRKSFEKNFMTVYKYDVCINTHIPVLGKSLYLL